MRIPDLSTPTPLLARGEPGCSDIDSTTQHARDVILSAYRGTLRRAGRGWYGPDKRFPIHRRTICALVERGFLYSADPNTARITKRGRWLARTIASEIAGEAFATATGRNDVTP